MVENFMIAPSERPRICPISALEYPSANFRVNHLLLLLRQLANKLQQPFPLIGILRRRTGILFRGMPDRLVQTYHLPAALIPVPVGHDVMGDPVNSTRRKTEAPGARIRAGERRLSETPWKSGLPHRRGCPSGSRGRYRSSGDRAFPCGDSGRDARALVLCF